MKNKKEIIEKIVLGILTFILIIYISTGLIFFSIFNISEKFFNKSSVTSVLNSINLTDIFKDKLGNEITEFIQIQEELLDIGISSEVLENFVNSDEVKEFSIDVVTKVFNKASNKSNIDYKITSEQINTLLKNNIDKLDSNSTISSEQILKKIQNKIPNLVLNINEMLDKLFEKLENSNEFKTYQNYLYSAVNLLDVVYSNLVKSLIIFIIISFIVLLMFIEKNIYKSLKWLSISFLLPSIFFYIIRTFIYKLVNTNNVLVNNVISIINRDIIKTSVIFVIISFVFVIINIIMYTIKKYKKKVSYEQKKQENYKSY